MLYTLASWHLGDPHEYVQTVLLDEGYLGCWSGQVAEGSEELKHDDIAVNEFTYVTEKEVAKACPLGDHLIEVYFITKTDSENLGTVSLNLLISG